MCIRDSTYLIFIAVALVATSLFSSLALGLNLLLVLVLVVVGGFLQNVIATRAAAQTAFNPARVMGVLLQGVTAMAGGSSAATNLAGAGFVAGSGAQARSSGGASPDTATAASAVGRVRGPATRPR